jgi:hypothetical protein
MQVSLLSSNDIEGSIRESPLGDILGLALVNEVSSIHIGVDHLPFLY